MQGIGKRALPALLLAVSACTGVETTREGEEVRVLAAGDVMHCRKMGQTTVQLEDKLWEIAHNLPRVQEELNTLARSSAIELQGDGVVPLGEAEAGKQAFAVYRCRRQESPARLPVP